MPEQNRNWSYNVPEDGNVRPEHLIEAVWSFLQWSEPAGSWSKPRSLEQLANLIQPAYRASLHSEEGRQVRLRVAFNPLPKRITAPFTEPRPYSYDQLVKLAPTIGIGSRLLVAAPDADSEHLVRIEGILDPDILPENRTHPRSGNGLLFFTEEVEALKIEVLGPGWIRVAAVPYRFELRDCCFREPLVVSRLKCLSDWFSEIPSRLGFEGPEERHRLAAALARRFFLSVLAKVSEARHGGCLLIVPGDADTTFLPLKMNFCTNRHPIQEAINQRAVIPVNAGFITNGPIDEDQYSEMVRSNPALSGALVTDRDLAQLSEFVASLAAVDGAVVLGRDLELLGFGAEISSMPDPSGEEHVEFGPHPSPVEQPGPISVHGFGMRHRSAFRFCRDVPGSLAFIVSQDGGIRLFHGIGGSVKQWVGLSAEQP